MSSAAFYAFVPATFYVFFFQFISPFRTLRGPFLSFSSIIIHMSLNNRSDSIEDLQKTNGKPCVQQQYSTRQGEYDA
jgi:hypothetical protein